jgi:predicted small lipoprotein YifL
MKQVGWIVIVGTCLVTAGCGQKGPLYLPDKNASVVTRPANSGATTTAPATQPAPASGSTAPNSTTTAPAKPPQDKNGNDDSQSTTPKG